MRDIQGIAKLFCIIGFAFRKVRDKLFPEGLHRNSLNRKPFVSHQKKRNGRINTAAYGDKAFFVHRKTPPFLYLSYIITEKIHNQLFFVEEWE
jgi:hypothetical protein